MSYYLMKSMTFRIIYKTTVLLLFLSAIHACNTASDEQRKFEDEAFSEPQGYTATDRNGNIIEGEEDPDDWRIAPLFSGFVEVNIPAYPNPVTAGIDNVTLELLVDLEESVHGLRIYGYNENQNRVSLIAPIDKTLEARFHEFEFNPDQLSYTGSSSNITGLHRIYITDGNNDLITYGDIMIR